VNRDRIKPTEKLFIVGGGNVGLIGAYHALQAGIDVIGIVEALPECGGYKVHLDKIKRLGIPIFTSHTVIRAEGTDHLKNVVISKIDNKYQPIKGSEHSFKADTLLIAVGLTPVDELKNQAEAFGLKTYAAGDAAVIAEASAAMFSGRISGRQILLDQGFDIEIPPEWLTIVDILRSRPGDIKKTSVSPKNKEIYPVIRCVQEIPCNPCTEACVLQSITIKDSSMMGKPQFEGDCLGCNRCVSICPGLAISLVDKSYDSSKKTARVTIPWELPDETITLGEKVTTTEIEGDVIGKGIVIAMKDSEWQDRRRLLSLEVPFTDADRVAGIRIKEPFVKNPMKISEKTKSDEDIIVCRCERVTKKDIIDYIEKSGTRDFNAIKAAIRVGAGACGGKTCIDLIMRIFKELHINVDDVEPSVDRPFNQEVPLKTFLKEEIK